MEVRNRTPQERMEYGMGSRWNRIQIIRWLNEFDSIYDSSLNEASSVLEVG